MATDLSAGTRSETTGYILDSQQLVGTVTSGAETGAPNTIQLVLSGAVLAGLLLIVLVVLLWRQGAADRRS